MKLTRPVPMWQQVANHVRSQILSGVYAPGQPLPSEEALSAEFNVSRPTIREGIKALVAEGLVEVFRPRGMIVRDPFGRPAYTEHHDSPSIRKETAWVDAGEPSYYRANATADQADLLGIPPGEPLLARAVTQQNNGLRRTDCVYLPFSVAESTPWADTACLPSPKEVYDYLAQQHTGLTWTEHVRARMPIGDENASLDIPPGVPLLIILRLAHVWADHAVPMKAIAMEEVRYRADQAEITYSLG
jgi:GntR family transcriptional regulator